MIAPLTCSGPDASFFDGDGDSNYVGPNLGYGQRYGANFN
jgi:hypothetical protein